MRLWMVAALLAGPAWADGERAGAFDYYVLSLSWSPGYCVTHDDPEQCGRGLGWIVHGLWPQYERGWPSYCRTAERNPSRAETAAMADITGTAGLAWHAWDKHGRCSGLSAEAYFGAERRAFQAVTMPEVLRQVDAPLRLPASVVEDAFLEANPGMTADGITITCEGGRIAEARICLTRELQPRDCGADVVRDCRMDDALLAPIE